jgi:hypothetical protein
MEIISWSFFVDGVVWRGKGVLERERVSKKKHVSM